MNKEKIEDLFKMAERTNKPCVEMNKRTLYMLKEYIEELQQENESLKEIEKEHQRINGELREVIKKAIEYIEYDLKSFLYSEEYKILLKILNKGK